MVVKRGAMEPRIFESRGVRRGEGQRVAPEVTNLQNSFPGRSHPGGGGARANRVTLKIKGTPEPADAFGAFLTRLTRSRAYGLEYSELD